MVSHGLHVHVEDMPPPWQLEMDSRGTAHAANYMPAERLLYKRLRTATGATDMVVAATTQFFYSPGTGEAALISRVLFDLVDNAMQVDKFGGLAALTNGVKVQVLESDGDTEVLDFLDGGTIKNNYEFSHLAGTDAFVEPTAGDDELLVRWSIWKSGAVLYLPPTRKFAVTIQDNLAGLAHFETVVQGILVPA